jgi:DNA-binding beta-propeller fold protein YncE
MKRLIPLLIVVLLAACGGDDEPRPTAPPATAGATPTATPTPTVTAPVTPPTVPAATASATSFAAEPTPEPLSPAPSPVGPLPLLAGQDTLGPSISVCAGQALSVGDNGTVYTMGQRDGQSCASAIDLATGIVEPVEPSVLPPPTEDVLEVTDPARGHLYVAEAGVVTAYDADGREIGPVLVLPPGEPEGFSYATALRLDEVAGRLYLNYQDFDGQAWIALADLATGETIADVPVPPGPWALTADGRLLFVGHDTLVVLDGATLALADRLSLSRRPAGAAIDPTGARLFVADAGGDLHVLDPATLAELDRLPGLGAAVNLDPRLGRLYVGDRYSGGVHVFDLTTLEPLGRIPQPGRPVASPADGLVYILEEGVYRADGATLELIAGRTTRNSGCNGCSYPTGVVVDPNSGLFYTTTYSVWVGKPGRTSQVAVDPRTGRAFVAATTGGYQVVYNLALYPDLSLGEPTRWIDGLYGRPLYNPFSDQLYLAQGGRLLVLDGQTLEFLGGVDVAARVSPAEERGIELLAADGESGWLYAAQGEWLLRFEPGGASLDRPAPELVDGLPGPVYGIAVSPDFARDATLFVRATNWETYYTGFYRSRDGGGSWERLRGGLPGPPNDLVFGADGRLYAALVPTGWRATPEGATWGEGVYVSDDDGDTWRPDSPGLTHLRVGRLHVAAEGTLYALAAAAAEPGHAASGPTLWARPPGQDWALLPVPDAGPLRLVNYTIPTSYTLAVRAYGHDLTGGGPLYQSWGDELRRSDDGGLSWRAVGRGPADYANYVLSGDDGGYVYWVGPEALWRSADDGTTWAVLRHPLLDTLPSLVTVTDVDGAETLFLGTKTGQVLVVPVAEAEWEKSSQAPTSTPLLPTPSPTSIPAVCDLPPAAPFVAVWDNPTSRERLGCPAQQAQLHPMAYQPFEGGVMIWDGADTPSIYVGLTSSGDWARYPDQFQEGDPESDPALTPPNGFSQPVRGFGLLWRGDEGLRQELGWALAPEVGFEGTWQVFAGGYAVAGPDGGMLWLFYFEGTPRWEEAAR